MKRIQSFEEVKRKRSRTFRFASFVILLYLVFEFFSTYVFKSWTTGSDSMAPTLLSGNKVITLSSAYGIYKPFSEGRFLFSEPEHGDIVVVRLPSSPRKPWYVRLADSLVRFATLQRIGIIDAGGMPVIKRIVACPGDSVMMDGFIAYVKLKGTNHYLTEYEVSGKNYDTQNAQTAKNWTKDMFLAGSVAALELGPNEYFILGDNRLSSSDSRFFGPVHSEAFLAKVIFRYWPFEGFSGL